MEEITDSLGFARAFGDTLQRFLQEKGISQSDAANQLGLEKKVGKARLNTYCHDSPRGKRPKPSAEVLYLVCARLGFAFEYNGYKISAAMLNGSGVRPVEEKQAEQLPLEFHGQFDLTDHQGTVSVSVKQPPGRVEVFLSLKAVL